MVAFSAASSPVAAGNRVSVYVCDGLGLDSAPEAQALDI